MHHPKYVVGKAGVMKVFNYLTLAEINRHYISEWLVNPRPTILVELGSSADCKILWNDIKIMIPLHAFV